MNATLPDLMSLLAALLAVIAAGLYLQSRAGVRARVNQRLRRATRMHATLASEADEKRRPAAVLAGALRATGSAVPLFNAAQRAEMAQKLVRAGYRGPGALPTLMGLSVGAVLIVVSVVITVAWPMLHEPSMSLRVGSLLVSAYLGLLLPRIVLDRMVVRYQKAIQRNFPDALDLLVVCTNAGLGLNAALRRVAEEMEVMAPELAGELALTSGQLQLSGDPAVVLHQFAERIGLPSIRSLVSTLIQSRRFGTPIGQALRVLARSERTARLMRTEEAAAKLATKITLPMMLFILPTVMLVAGGPAALNLMAAFAK